MGSRITTFIPVERSIDGNISTSKTSEFDDSMSLINFSIPDDLLIDILSFVPWKDLIKNCRVVCKEWKNIVDSHCIWKLKCKREKKKIPRISLKNIPHLYYRNIYIHNPYGRNLIYNPCGEEGLDNWRIILNRGDGFVIQNPPLGADPVPQEVGSQSCFATSFSPCTKYQLIDLFAYGIAKEVLQAKSTKIEIGEWFAARFDCASQYLLYVCLLNEDFNENETPMEDFLIDRFEFQYKEDQWVGKEWHFVNHTFENVGQVRYVYFQHFGKDCQFWAGHYGSKMTGGFVKVAV